MPYYTLPPLPECMVQRKCRPVVQCDNSPGNESAKISRLQSQTIQADTPTNLSFDNVVYDTDGLFNGDQPTTFTIRRSGFYIIGASIDWAASGTSDARKVSILLNGTQMASQSELSLATDDTLMTISTSAFLKCGDKVQLQVSQGSTGSLSLVTTAGPPTFWVQSVHLTNQFDQPQNKCNQFSNCQCQNQFNNCGKRFNC